MEFTDDEIRDELARLGYQNVPSDKLNEFKKDLLKLIQAERSSKNNSLNSSVDESKQLFTPEVGQEFNTENFTNHGSQWMQEEYKNDRKYSLDDKKTSPENYREDWEYRGEKSKRDPYDVTSNGLHGRTAKSATSGRNGAPGSYALHELPIDMDMGNRHAAVNKSNNMDLDCPSKVVKRKTCRTMADGARIIDESFTESETEDIFNIYQKIKSMAVRDCECGKSKGTSGDVEPPYRNKSGKKKIPSYIRKPLPPHTRNLKTTNPFGRMAHYEKLWKQQPVPGEGDRTELLKKIHSKMLQKDEVKVDNKVYVPNTFKIPSDNPRTALRWRVRSALEKYELPEHGYYHDI